jgi:diaminohydroxyphosphoribosylaminopyrimidine deaminase / 5-amino-6-(5-phosphoribosylamino)uracil reductase
MAAPRQSPDARWMDRALALARRGEALAHPNPLVGAVLVKRGRVVGEGFHRYEGRAHAEVLAIEKAGKAARGATLYVNLEPCCHAGRTAPCTQAILAAGITRVVAAMRDPNRAVSGRGFVRLRRAGVNVTAGVREEEARRLNEPFACWIRTRRPFVTLKSAATLDGRIGLRGKSVTWITSPASREEVQRLRHASDALLTGIGTVLADDPRLSDRTGRPRRRPLLRVILDSRLRLPLRSKLVRSARGDVLVFTTRQENSARARALRRAGVEIVRVRSHRGRVDLRAALRELGRREILSVLLEGGAELNGAALRAGIVDKLILFLAPKILGSAAVPFAAGRFGSSPWRSLAAAPELRISRIARFGPDLMLEIYLP